MDIDIIYDSRNYTLIKDLKTNIIWLYSFQKPIAYWDGKIHINMQEVKTQTNKFHISNFKKYFEN